MSNKFSIDHDTLRANAAAARKYAAELRKFADNYDSEEYYQALAKAVGIVNAPDVAAARAHGKKLREDTELLASRYEAIAEGSLGSIADVTGTDETSSGDITRTTRGI